MQDIFRAYRRAFASLSRPDIFWHLMWPTLAAITLWIVLAIFFWGDAVAALMDLLARWSILREWLIAPEGMRVLTTVLLGVVVLMLAIPLVFVTSAILVGAFALPLMLDRVAATDYRDLEQRRGGSQIGSVVNATWAAVLFAGIAVVTLPLWLIPGVGLLLSVFLSAWLNLRCYRYDALMNHADENEMRALPARHRGALYALGLGAGVLVLVPVLNLFVPAFTGLAFVHYLLEALRRDRGRHPV